MFTVAKVCRAREIDYVSGSDKVDKLFTGSRHRRVPRTVY